MIHQNESLNFHAATVPSAGIIFQSIALANQIPCTSACPMPASIGQSQQPADLTKDKNPMRSYSKTPFQLKKLRTLACALVSAFPLITVMQESVLDSAALRPASAKPNTVAR
jgi:hypothetical protein